MPKVASYFHMISTKCPRLSSSSISMALKEGAIKSPDFLHHVSDLPLSINEQFVNTQTCLSLYRLKMLLLLKYSISN